MPAPGAPCRDLNDDHCRVAGHAHGPAHHVHRRNDRIRFAIHRMPPPSERRRSIDERLGDFCLYAKYPLWRHPVQNLCFKPRPGGNTVQLVRHAYDPTTKRSRTITVGNLDLRADLSLFPKGLTLRSGSRLDEAEQQKAADYLRTHANPSSCEQREALIARIREELSDAASGPEANPFVVCAKAIAALTKAIPQLANETREAGSDPWLMLRPSYLALSEDWKALVGAAQSAGIAKQYKRGGPSAADDI